VPRCNPFRKPPRVGVLARVGFFALLLLSLPSGAQAPESSPSGSSAAQRTRELEAIRSEIATLETRLRDVRKRLSGVEGDLAALDVELSIQTQRLAEAVAARDLAVAREAEIVREIARLEAEVKAARAALAERLSGLYRFGRQGYLRLALSMRPDSRLLPSIRLLRFLSRRDAQSIERSRSATAALAREERHLAAERKDRESWVAAERSRRSELLALRSRQEALVARLGGERRSLSAAAGSLTEKERKLSSFLDLLVGRNPNGPAGTSMVRFRGVLDWPVRGRVTVPFGPRLDPRYRTAVPHNGVDLETRAGDQVVAVYAGKVLYAAPFAGYGWTVVVMHPGQVLTLYAGLTELKVGAGDGVSLGQSVGVASDTLYFEVRVENRPENPITWLR
jgi:murein hydrolase activator